LNVFVRSSAREDILEQYFYYLVEKEASQIAERFLIAVQEAVEAICRNPGIGVPKFFNNPRLSGLRSWPISGFPSIRLYYLLAGDELRVVRVLHGKRDLNAILENAIPESETPESTDDQD
jgi:toxin ParE1/3/4